jgi:deoxyhypusine synthase
MCSHSLFQNFPDIIPTTLEKNASIPDLIQYMGQTSFEARNVYRGSELFRQIIDDGDTNWLGIAGAGIAGGMGGLVITLLQNNFIDVICSTGAQIYHDLHFAFDLPVKAIPPNWDDNLLRQHGDTRIYDIGIREKETLEAQDKMIRDFIIEKFDVLSESKLSSWEFNYQLGLWVQEKAPYPERSFVCTAAQQKTPIFWDSQSNHSIAMNILRTNKEGYPLNLSAQKDIHDSAAIVYTSQRTGFIELGGGGPKNFIQQTGPMINQIYGIDFLGADRGIQISTAVEREGSLSSCTFGEAVTWGKYKESDHEKLVQIWGEYSIIFPLIVAYILHTSKKRKSKQLVDHLPELADKLKNT